MNRASLARPVPTASYRTFVSSTSNGATYTFNTVDIGTASTTRLVVVAITGTSSQASGRTVNSVNIGGISATGYQNPSVIYVASFWAAFVPTGTTANIIVVFSGTMANCGIGVYDLNNLKSAISQGGDSQGVAGGTVINLSLPVTDTGVVIAAGTFATGTSSTATWSGVTERYDTLVETGMRTGASAIMTASNSAYAVSCTSSLSNTGRASAASWR